MQTLKEPPKAVLFFHDGFCDLLFRTGYRDEVIETFADIGYLLPGKAPPVCERASEGVDWASRVYGASYVPFPAHFIDISKVADYQKAANFALKNRYAVLSDSPPIHAMKST